jgi:vacuolar-type H+-ATPase subunit B/Vma2
MQMGVQVRLFKGGFVFLFMLNGGKVPIFEGNRLAFPFLAATVAEKAEIKDSIAGIIN